MSPNHRLTRFIVFASVLILTSGCAGVAPYFESPKAAEPAPVNKAKPVEEDLLHYTNLPPAEGSLWTENGMLLFSDRRARRVGDTVIVDISENTTSQMAANTKTSKKSTLSGDVPNMLGYIRSLESKNPNLRNGGNSQLLSASMTNEHTGAGTSDRSGSITASIGAMVTEVLPNGNVVIFGKRDMEVNNEIQTITVSGIARPEDIGSDNRVKSTYLANSRISYSGKGALADKQHPGWLARILDHVWPF